MKHQPCPFKGLNMFSNPNGNFLERWSASPEPLLFLRAYVWSPLRTVTPPIFELHSNSCALSRSWAIVAQAVPTRRLLSSKKCCRQMSYKISTTVRLLLVALTTVFSEVFGTFGGEILKGSLQSKNRGPKLSPSVFPPYISDCADQLLGVQIKVWFAS